MNINLIKDQRLKNHFKQNGKRINLFHKEGGKFFLPQGDHRFTESDLGPVYPIHVPYPPFKLYDYQKEAVDNFVSRSKNYKVSCIVSGTGTGKSYMIFAAILAKARRTVIVVPKKILAIQLREDMRFHLDIKVIVGSKPKLNADIVIMTGQTFNKRYDEINGKFDFMIMDECHRCPEKRRQQLFTRSGTCILGLTATLKRKEFDAKGFKFIFGEPIRTNKEALPVVVYKTKRNNNYTVEQYMNASAGLNPDSPEINRNLIVTNDERNQHIFDLAKLCISKGMKRIIIFTDRVKHIGLLMEKFRGVENVFPYYGGTNQVEVKNKCSSLDSYIIIGNVSCCGEGFNVPSIQVGILTVSTQRSVTIDQAVGRVRRKQPNKKYGFLIDIQDTISIEGSAKKPLGYNQRNKIYKEKKWRVLSLPDPYAK